MQPSGAQVKGIVTKPHQVTPQPREALVDSLIENLWESSISKRLVAIFKTECFNQIWNLLLSSMKFYDIQCVHKMHQ